MGDVSRCNVGYYEGPQVVPATSTCSKMEVARCGLVFSSYVITSIVLLFEAVGNMSMCMCMCMCVSVRVR